MNKHLQVLAVLALLILPFTAHSETLPCFDISYSPLQASGIDLQIGVVEYVPGFFGIPIINPGDVVANCDDVWVTRPITPSGEPAVISTPAGTCIEPHYSEPAITISGNKVLLESATLPPVQGCGIIPELVPYHVVALNLPDGVYSARWIIDRGTSEERVSSTQFRVGTPSNTPNSVPTLSVWAGILLSVLMSLMVACKKKHLMTGA